MNTSLYYYTGTGNSLWIARMLAKELGDAGIIPISRISDGICKTVCPCGNIELQAGKPVWLHHCEQCLACIQWCPPEAIQFGKKTPRYERYRHPEVKLSDIIAVQIQQREKE